MRSLIAVLLGLGVALGLAVLLLFSTKDAPDEGATPPATTVAHGSGAVLPGGLPFSEAVRVGDTVYLSGMIGVAPGTMDLVPGGLEAETRRTLDNIRTVLEANGASMDDVVRCTVMMADIAEWAAFNAIYETYFDAPYPARSAFGATGLALGARVEVECVAAVGR